MRGEGNAIHGRWRSCVYGWVALALLLVLAPAAAWAHKVTVFAWVEGDTVHTESKFSGGRVAKDARIEVYGAAGEKLLEGRTDAEGRFAFQPPRTEDLRIVLVAGSGHRNEWLVRAVEFAGASPGASPPPTPPAAEPRPSVAADAPERISLSPAELQALIEAALDKKLAPLVHRLGQLGQGPTLPDIIGGIGYILGLVGLATYFKNRRRSG